MDKMEGKWDLNKIVTELQIFLYIYTKSFIFQTARSNTGISINNVWTEVFFFFLNCIYIRQQAKYLCKK